MSNIIREGQEPPARTGSPVDQPTQARGSDDEIVRLKKDIDDLLVDVAKSNSRNEPQKRLPQAPHAKPEARDADERIGVSPFQLLLTIGASVAATFISRPPRWAGTSSRCCVWASAAVACSSAT